MRLIPLLASITAFAGAPALAFPITVESCGREVQFAAPPERPITVAGNVLEFLLALGLEDRLHGVAGARDRIDGSSDLYPAATKLRSFQKGAVSLELMLEEGVDFYFAGWGYGLRAGSDITPETLQSHGISVYELSESCIRLGQKTPASFEYLHRDLRNLAQIFGVPERAEALIAQHNARLARLREEVAKRQARPSVFVYDSGDRVAVSAGAYAMPQAIITAAGGRNVLEDMPSSWLRVDWETVIDRAPEVIVIVDYGAVSAAEKIEIFKSNPAFATIPAVRDDRFIVLGYDDLTPGPRNIHATEALAAYLAR